MLQIILLIVKIIGIILFVVLGILLTVFFVVLFVPVGYHIGVENREGFSVKVNGWWLFHGLDIVFVREGLSLEEKEKKSLIKVRILGIPIIDSTKSRKVPKWVASEAKREKKKKEPEKQPERQEKRQQSPEKGTTVPQEREPELTIQQAAKAEAPKPKKEPDYVRAGKEEANRKTKINAKEETNAKTNTNVKVKTNIKKETSTKINTIKRILKFIKNEENVNGMKQIFTCLKGLLKKLLPRRIRGELLFGTDDPCTTGQILAVLAVLYPYYGKSFSIVPDFTGAVLQGKADIKGQIRVFTLCRIGIKLITDTNFKKLVQNFKKW